MIAPIIAAFAAAAGIIMDKIVLTYQKIGHRQLVVLLFLFLFIICAIFYPIFGKIDSRAFGFEYLLLLIFIIIIASVYNVLYYHGIEKEKIAEVELITMLTPLFTILIASIFLQAERNWGVFFAGIIASGALIISHINHHHLSFDVFQKGLILYLILFPIEAVLIKNILFLYSPLALYMVRTLGVFIVLGIWYLTVAPYVKGEPKLDFQRLKTKNYLWCLAIAILAVIQMSLTYFGYAKYGVVYTTIVLALTPILVYLGCAVILKEKLKKRMIAAAIVILGCIVYASISLGK